MWRAYTKKGVMKPDTRWRITWWDDIWGGRHYHLWDGPSLFDWSDDIQELKDRTDNKGVGN